jgi:hypothetical protein
MSNGYLTTHEFERWTKGDQHFKDQMLHHIEAARVRDTMMGERIAVVETEIENAGKNSRNTSAKWSTGISALLAIVFNALINAFSGK